MNLRRDDPLHPWLADHGACSEALEWAKSYSTLGAAWDACPRSDWMVWALRRLGYRDRKVWRLYACRCCREIWRLLADERSRHAVEVAERYALGQATAEELDAARSGAWEVRYGAAAAAAAAAAYSAAAAAYSADAADAADAADSAAAAAYSDLRDARRKQADILRELINPFKES
jgi:hypothetical protein